MKKVTCFGVIVALILAAGGCVSNQLRNFVGEPITEAYMAYGEPEDITELPDGLRAYNFRFGDNAISEGCRMTLITDPSDDPERVLDYRVPKGLVC